MQWKARRNRRAVAMLEVIFALSVMAILTASIIGYWGYARLATRARDYATDIRIVVDNIHKLYASKADYSDNMQIQDILVGARMVPPRILRGGVLINPFSSYSDLYTQLPNMPFQGKVLGEPYIQVFTGRMPHLACAELMRILGAYSDLIAVSVNYAPPITPPFTAEIIADACYNAEGSVPAPWWSFDSGWTPLHFAFR